MGSAAVVTAISTGSLSLIGFGINAVVDSSVSVLLVWRFFRTGGPEMIAAQAAFWTGLLYDEVALDGALDLVKGWTAAEREAVRATVPRLGLATPVAGRSIGAVAAEALALARAGLQRRGRRD